jgi:hypothetical protein
VWIDFREIQDAYMRAHGIDYFENSRRATYIQAYAIRNPKRFARYGEHRWGITASNGPGPATRRVNGVNRRFLGYRPRAVPNGPDEGTIAPWAVVASLPFAPENRPAHASALPGSLSLSSEGTRAGVQHQPDVPRIPTKPRRLDFWRPLRGRSGSGRFQLGRA